MATDSALRLDHLCQVSILNPDLFVRLGQLARGEWNDAVVNLLQFCVAAAAFGVVMWGWRLQRSRRQDLQRIARGLLLALGSLSGLAYFNFGQLHFGDVIHTWDTYHYYVGAKYFPELGYERLYHCAVVSDAEGAATPEELNAVRERIVNDLRTNQLVKADVLLQHASTCKERFSAVRWQQFRSDVNFFKSRVNPEKWASIHHDHGFNGTPVWVLLGRALANTGPATKTQIRLLWLLDPLYLALMGLMLWWAFGLEALAVGLIILGTNYPNRYYWTGGAFLRYDWLFFLVAVVCLLKKEKFALAGAALAYSTLLRLFPGLLLVGPMAAAVVLLRRTFALPGAPGRTRAVSYIDPRLIKFFAGGVGATATLLILSLAFTGGVDAWKRFRDNTMKHASTPLTNHMGLQTILSYRPADAGSRIQDQEKTDPWLQWKERRRANFDQMKGVYWGALILCCIAVYLSLRGTKNELWPSAALGVGMIAFGSELTCYYYCFLIGLAPLHQKRPAVGVVLIGLSAATQAIALTGITPRNEDTAYVAMSALTLLAIASIWWMFATRTTDATGIAGHA